MQSDQGGGGEPRPRRCGERRFELSKQLNEDDGGRRGGAGGEKIDSFHTSHLARAGKLLPRDVDCDRCRDKIIVNVRAVTLRRSSLDGFGRDGVSILHRRAMREFGGLWAWASVVALIATGASSPAFADPNGGTVSGAIELPAVASRKKLPNRGSGFIRRMKGPLKEPKRADDRSRMIVVLVGGPVADADAKPPKRTARYNLIGESFETDIFAYVAGQNVEVKNNGHISPRLYAVGADEAIEPAPVGPRGDRKVKAPSEALQSMEIRDRDSVHLRGTIVAMPHRYFALVGRNGSYTIKGVPAGSWTVKIWFDGGWLELPSSRKVTVVAKKPAKASTIKLPAELSSKPAAEE